MQFKEKSLFGFKDGSDGLEVFEFLFEGLVFGLQELKFLGELFVFFCEEGFYFGLHFFCEKLLFFLKLFPGKLDFVLVIF